MVCISHGGVHGGKLSTSKRHGLSGLQQGCHHKDPKIEVSTREQHLIMGKCSVGVAQAKGWLTNSWLTHLGCQTLIFPCSPMRNLIGGRNVDPESILERSVVGASHGHPIAPTIDGCARRGEKGEEVLPR